MSLRINNAKNFAGKKYMVSNEVDSLIESIKLGALDDKTSSAVMSDEDWELNYNQADGGASTQVVNLNPIKKYVDAKSTAATTSVKQADGVTITSAVVGTAMEYTVGAHVDDKTISAKGGSLKSLLQIKKLETAADGYAASYVLADVDGKTIEGSTQIDIVKDQFLKSGSVVWGQSATAAPKDEVGTAGGYKEKKEGAWKYAFVRLEMYTAKDGAAGSKTSTIFIPAQEMFQSYVAGNGIDPDELAKNNLTVVVDNTEPADKIFTEKGISSDVLSVTANGVKATGIQSAIDLAAGDVRTKTNAALTALHGDVTTFESNVNTALSGMNDAIDTKITSDISAVNTKVKANYDAIVAESGKVEVFKTAVNGAIDSVESKATTAINAAAGDVRTKTNTAIGDMNVNIGAFKDTVVSAIDNVEKAISTTVTSFEASVNDFESAIKTNVDAALADVCKIEAKLAAAPVKKDPGSTIASMEVKAVEILSVHGSDGIEIYPEITKGEASTDGNYTYTLTADFGTLEPDEWTVICNVKHVEFTKPECGAMSYTGAGTNDIAFTNGAEVGTLASQTVAATDDLTYAKLDSSWTDITCTSKAEKKTASFNDTAAQVAELDYRTAAVAP